MPILTASGQPLEFQPFWCDVRDPGGSEPGLVVLAFAQPFPGDSGLVVIGHHGGAQHGVLLHEQAKGTSAGRSLLGVPVPAEWHNFNLVLTPFSGAALGPEVRLSFARQAPQGAAPSGQTLHIVAAGPWIEAKLHSGSGPFSSRLRLHQYMAAGTILPSRRVADTSAVPYRLEVRPPKVSLVTEPWVRRSTPSENTLIIGLHARNEDAIRSIEDTLLWYLSQAQIAPPDPTTLGTFAPAEDRFDRFTPVIGAWRKPDVMEFAVPGATPGDVFCLAPGLEDAAINLGPEIAPAAAELDKGLLVFEIDRNGNVVRLGQALERPNPNKALDRGAQDNNFKDLLRKQVARIRGCWAGGKKEIGRLADLISNISDSRYPVDLAAMEDATDSPAQFALCVALLHELLRKVEKEAAELMAIVGPGRARIVERICSAATWRSVGDKTIREALGELTSGTYDPWRAPDGLRAVFETVFEVQAKSASDKASAEQWYSQTNSDPVARAALLAIERRSTERAWIMIRAGIKPSLHDLTRKDLTSITSFCEKHLLLRSRDLALTDAICFACQALEQQPGLASVAEELRQRIKRVQTDDHAAPGLFLPLDDVRRLRAAVQDVTIAAKLGQIHDALNVDRTTSEIPRFERLQAPLDRATSATDLIQKLNQIGNLPPHWAKLRDEATISAPWPAAALAALLVTLTHRPPKEPPLPKDKSERQQVIDRLLSAAGTDDPDARTAHFLFDRIGAATGFIKQLKDLWEKFVEEHEQELSKYPELLNKRFAARSIADARLIPIAQQFIDEQLEKVKEASERIDQAMKNVEKSINDPDQLKQLNKIAEDKAGGCPGGC